ncbi:hypothetical protein CL621_04605 [archaeon]|nr:hypothetical protein [archaeon]|tara:strand:+ start:1010 stop:1855 length:846 start_codon:yes stop_codon:yes gene_type:complete
MKKGTIHLDWVISIGIFLLYILFFFVFITPFYKPDTQEGVNTLDILEDNLRKEVYWNITRMPIFIIDCSECVGLAVEDFCLPSFPFGNWGQNEIIFTEDFNNPVNINFEINDNCGSDGTDPGDGHDIDDFTFSYNIATINKKTFWIIYNEGENYGNGEWSNGDCYNYIGEPPICNFLTYAESGGDYEYFYGLDEKIFGISESKFSGLNYDDIKSKWNFPEGAEFWIEMEYVDGDKGIIEPFPFGNKNHYEQADVYVREWGDYILDKYGIKEAIKINVGVWR